MSLIENYAFDGLQSADTYARQQVCIGNLVKAIQVQNDIAKALGLQRRQKNIPQSISEIVASVRERQ